MDQQMTFSAVKYLAILGWMAERLLQKPVKRETRRKKTLS